MAFLPTRQPFFGGLEATPPTTGSAYASIFGGSSSNTWATTESWRRSLFVLAGTIAHFRVNVNVDPTATGSYEFTLLKNGSATGTLSVTISNGVLEAVNTSSMSVAANDDISLRCTVTGTPVAFTYASWSMVFEPTAAKRFVLSAGTGNGTGDIITTEYQPASGGITWSASLTATRATVVPINCTIRSWRLNMNGSQGGTRSMKYHIYKNGVQEASSEIELTSSDMNLTGLSIDVAPGDFLSVGCTTTGTAGTAIFGSWGIEVEPDTDGEAMISGAATSVPTGTYYFLTTNFSAIAGDTAEADRTTEAGTKYIFTLTSLYVILTTAPGAGTSRTFTVQKNSAASALTTTIADTATSNADTSNSVSFTDGNEMSIRTTVSGTPVSTAATWGLGVKMEWSETAVTKSLAYYVELEEGITKGLVYTVEKELSLTKSVQHVISLAKTETVSDNFNDDSLDETTKWYNWGGAEVDETNNQLEFSVLSGGGNYHGIEGKYFKDLTSSSISIELVNAGNQSLASLEVVFSAFVDSNNSIFMLVTNNALIAYRQLSGSNQYITQTTYNPSNHKYLRLREAAGTAYWEHSANGVTWNTLHSETNPMALTSVKTGVVCGVYANEASSTTVIFDNYNVLTLSATKSLAYTIEQIEGMTKSLAYYVKPTIAVTKTVSYSVEITDSLVKGLTYSVLTVDSLTAPIQYALLNTQGPLSETLQYNVVTTSSEQKSINYEVLSDVASFKSLEYAVLTRESTMKDAAYSVITQTDLSEDAQYAVKTDTVLQKSDIYSVLTIGEETKVLTYFIDDENVIQKGLMYAVQTTDTVSSQTEYRILTTDSDSKNSEYRVVTQLASQKDLSYVVETYSSFTKTIAYAVKTEDVLLSDVKYTVVVPISEVKDTDYYIKTVESQAKDLDYEVSAPVSLTKTTSYSLETVSDVQRSIEYYIKLGDSMTKSLVYHVVTSATQTKQLQYTTVEKIYSREANATLPSTESQLSTLYSDPEYTDVATDDDVYVDQAGGGYLLHQFKKYGNDGVAFIRFTWRGKSTVAPSVSAVHAQLYDYTLAQWVTVATNNTAAADTEFQLSVLVDVASSDYYGPANVVTGRIYQQT